MILARLILLLAVSLALAPQAAADRAAPTSREAIHLSFAPLVKRVAPAVVNVFSRRVVRSNLGPGSLFNDPLFRRFFGEDSPFGMPRDRVENSLGSGVIIDSGGLIVTNRHVIEGGQEIRVVLADRREFDASIILSDEHADLAVLRIDAHGERLPSLEIGDSDQIEVGDLVLAIGNPFGVGQTVTSGIVSGLARSIGGNDYGSFVQTDAAINPGNSGGALVDMDGRLIGINTAIVSQSGGSVGIGFATPANLVRTVLEAATHGGHVTRPWFGAVGQPVTQELARSLHLPLPQGVLVKDIAPGSPAAKAGLRVGDVIVAINGHEVADPQELRFRIATLSANSRVTISVRRGGSMMELAAALTPPPEQPSRDLTTMRGREPFAGATVGNLNPAFAEELGLEATRTGVIVKEVADDSIAAGLGIEPGDIVVSVNDREIGSVGELQRSLGTGPPWRLTILRGDKRLTVTVGS